MLLLLLLLDASTTPSSVGEELELPILGTGELTAVGAAFAGDSTTAEAALGVVDGVAAAVGVLAPLFVGRGDVALPTAGVNHEGGLGLYGA